MKASYSLVALALVITATGSAQDVDRGRRVPGDLRLKVWLQAGTVSLTGWDRDSLHVRGSVGQGAEFFMGGAGDAYKLVVDAAEGLPVSHLEIFLPRGSQVSVKSVAANVEARNVSGWFSSVAGDITLRGEARRLEAETLEGNLVVDAQAPWLRARTGGGALELIGRYQDVVAATVSGPMVIRNKMVSRGRFESVTGDISYSGAFDDDAQVEFDSHEGDITISIPSGGALALTAQTVSGEIANQLTGSESTNDVEGPGSQLELVMGEPGNRVVVRTFRGTIVLRPMR